MFRILTRLTIPLIILVSIFTSANLKWGPFWKYTITSDGKGYYAYLPAIFIYKDLNIGFFDTIEAKYYDEHTKYDFRTGIEGKPVDKYFCGVAVLQAPFFLAAHAITKISGGEADGYSKLYVIFICLGAIFYLTIGLVFLRKYLLMNGATEGQAALVVALIYFGTNLFYYTLVEPMMSHVYSFALVCLFLVYGKRWLTSGNNCYALIASLLLGMIVLIRPINFIIAFWLIFDAGGIQPLIRKKLALLREFKTAFLALLLFILPVSLQLIVYKIETGHFFVDTYGPEGFNFARPEIFNFLFSYRKGLFIYLPLTFVAIFGLITLWKKDKFKAAFTFLYLFFVVYVLSSWWMWYYGGSFGTRVIIEFLPVFALLLLFLLQELKTKALRISVAAVLILLVLYCQFETFQYRYLMIHWSDMNEAKYWEVFLKWPGH